MNFIEWSCLVKLERRKVSENIGDSPMNFLSGNKQRTNLKLMFYVMVERQFKNPTEQTNIQHDKSDFLLIPLLIKMS